jgi:site-specific DNA-methyltransferase (adenine-specific)
VTGLFPQAGGGFGKRGASSSIYGGGKGFTDATGETIGFGDSGSAARFFYCAKASQAERDAGIEGLPEVPCGMMEDDAYDIKTGSGNSRDTRRRNHHPTVKPVALMEYLVRLACRPGGTVLDPFMGSGTTGIACIREGMKFIGIEKSPEYFEIAKARLENELKQKCLPI